MKFNITYWLKRMIFLVLILVQVGNVYGAPEVLAGIGIEGVEVAYGHDTVNAWGAVKHLDPKIKLNPNILERISSIRTAGKIPVEKFDDALNSHLGDILNSADEVDINKILDVLKKNHVNAEHFEKITYRLNKYPDLKQDFIDNPSWFQTFDDILENPGRYKEIFDGAEVPTKAELRKWANGFWKKEYFKLADDFEKGPALAKFVDEYGVDNVVSQVTLEVTDVNGVVKKIRVDQLALDLNTGQLHLGDAKFSSKSKNWQNDWFETSTPNQKDVYKWFEDGTVKEIKVKASQPQKLDDLSNIGLKNDSKIVFGNSTLRIFGSEANALSVKTVVTIK